MSKEVSEVLKFSEFNETMQYAVLKHSKDLHDKEVERRKEKTKEDELKKSVTPTLQKPEHLKDREAETEEVEDMETEESEEVEDMETEESESDMERYESLRIRLFGR